MSVTIDFVRKKERERERERFHTPHSIQSSPFCEIFPFQKRERERERERDSVFHTVYNPLFVVKSFLFKRERERERFRYPHTVYNRLHLVKSLLFKRERKKYEIGRERESGMDRIQTSLDKCPTILRDKLH
jgi:hypothetical protein